MDQYERLLDVTDTELLPVITGEKAIPDHLSAPILTTILAFRQARSF